MFNKNLLRGVARAYGVQCSYRNVDNKTVWSPDKTLVKILEDLSHVKVSDENDLKNLLLAKSKESFENKLKKCLVAWNGVVPKIKINSNLELSPELDAVIKLENNESVSVKLIKTETRKSSYGFKSNFKISEKLPVGYHHLEIVIENKKCSLFLICPPEKLETKKTKTWGPFIPLYALKSETDWGIGSLKEASDVARALTPFGGKWMGMLPMLAGNFDYADCDPSPYSSLSRLFWNEIYLDVDFLVEKYNHAEAKAKIASVEFKERTNKLRNTTHVDYYGVYQLKKEILLLLSDSFFALKKNNDKEFVKFEKENPEINAYAAFRSSELRIQNFHKFVQFEMNNSLEKFSSENNFGLYMDYPVGVNDAGFDYRQFRSVFFGEVSVGAPPEPVFALGQDWGFPAFHPEGMQVDEYKYFRKSLQHHLKFCKILRLDHIMGLHRIYSVPKKFKGDEGVYLRFPPEELFAIVILEAHRAGADLIGENLGTVPAAVDKIIRERNLNGMWVMQCETWRSPEKAIEAIPENSLVCINTHDMPMLASFKKCSDLNLVNDLKILSNEYKNKFSIERKEQISIWESKLTKDNFNESIIKLISSSKSKYFVVNLEDLWSEEMPQNIPGTWKEYPNWRKKFTHSVEQWNKLPQVKNIFSLLKETRSEK